MKKNPTTIASAISAGQQIYNSLKQSIVNCKYAPGEAISDKQISELFGVSRQPVRDAFIKLSEAGLIQILPQRGTFVTKISTRQVRNARFIREAVETAIVRRAALSISDEYLMELDTILTRQIFAAQTNDKTLFLQLDDEFHYVLAQSIDCIEAWEMIEHIKAQMDRVRFLTMPDFSPISKMVEQHKAVVEGLRAHDPDKAAAAMHMHLTEISQTFRPTADSHPDWFEND